MYAEPKIFMSKKVRKRLGNVFWLCLNFCRFTVFLNGKYLLISGQSHL